MHFFDDGFRPFFLGAAALASAHVLFWLLFLTGNASGPQGWSPMVWHGHEMVFGFSAALIAGFLLTAAANWTGQPIVGPKTLASLFALWVIPRVGVIWPVLPVNLIQFLSAAFFPALAMLVGYRIIQTRNSRNYWVVGILVALSAAGVIVHLVQPMAILRAATDVILILMVAMGARIIPFFTTRRMPQLGLQASPRLPWVTVTTVTAAVVSAWVFEPSLALASVNILAGALVITLLWQWKPWHVLKEPMLWILHLGYLWLGIALMLRGFGAYTATALHAITMGGLGCLAVGMMTRVALGHSGREIRADAVMILAFTLVALAAAPRLLYPLLSFNGGRVMLALSAALWALGFLLYFVRFVPIMFAVRRT